MASINFRGMYAPCLCLLNRFVPFLVCGQISCGKFSVTEPGFCLPALPLSLPLLLPVGMQLSPAFLLSRVCLHLSTISSRNSYACILSLHKKLVLWAGCVHVAWQKTAAYEGGERRGSLSISLYQRFHK